MLRVSRRLSLALAAVLALALPDPPPATAWGTLTGGLHMTAAEQQQLRDLITNYVEAARRAALLGELPARIGAHPVHQFIVQQALRLVAEDPAAKDGPPALPPVGAVNAWDGVERCEHGMKPTLGGGLVGDLPDLAPVTGHVGGPGADAELSTPIGNPFAPGGPLGASVAAAGVPAGVGPIVASLGYNAFYNGRAHYYSPFLDDGAAPTQAAANYSRLTAAIVAGVRGEPLGHYAAYMAHYISDPTSAKHADAFTLDAGTLAAMVTHADAWIAARSDDLRVWLATQPITDAIATLRSRTDALSPANSARYWARVASHITNIGGTTPLFEREGVFVWLAPSSLRSAVACYLLGLAERAPGKSLDAFYTFFDPFYFNGPIFQVKQEGWTTSYDPPSFQVCTPLSEHLFWETNPRQFELVQEWSGKDTPWLGAGDPRGKYVAWTPTKGFLDLDEEVGRQAMEATMVAMVRRCSEEAHGDIDSAGDWQPDFQDHMKVAVRCVATGFRASISAIRAESWGRRVKKGADIRLQLSVRSAGGVPGKLTAARVSIRDPATGRLASRPGWSFPLGDRALGAEPVDVGVLVQAVPAGVEPTDLVVDLRADFGPVPDSGRARVTVADRGTETVMNPGADALSAPKGPVDVIVVMDTTGSMGGSLADLRRNAISSIGKLRERSSDLRLAVATFRDLEEEDDKPFFVVSPFDANLSAQFAFLNKLGPGGGGDTPEDQLHGISMGLNLWETEAPNPDRVPTKIIIVITDAPGKSPDSMGNTFDSIARRAEEVDPAHIYPIVVGRNPTAAAHAQELATKTGGRVLSAASGDEVAAALLAAVEDAVVSYAAPAPPRGTRWGLVGLAALLLVAASLLAGLALRARRRVAQPAAGGL